VRGVEQADNIITPINAAAPTIQGQGERRGVVRMAGMAVSPEGCCCGEGRWLQRLPGDRL